MKWNEKRKTCVCLSVCSQNSTNETKLQNKTELWIEINWTNHIENMAAVCFCGIWYFVLTTMKLSNRKKILGIQIILHQHDEINHQMNEWIDDDDEQANKSNFIINPMRYINSFFDSMMISWSESTTWLPINQPTSRQQ